MKGSTVGDIMISGQDSGQCNNTGLYTAYGDQFMIGSCHTISVVTRTIISTGLPGFFRQPTDEDDGQHHDHDQGADLRDDLPVIESRQERDRTGPPLDVRVGHARVDGRTPDRGEQPEEAEPREQGDDSAPVRACACRSR